MGERKYFDCGVEIGIRRIMNPGSFYETTELLRKMKYYGIEKALAYHSLSTGYHPATGNDILMEQVADIPELLPCWVVMPHHTGEFPEPQALRQSMKRRGVRAVKMCPANHGYSTAEWNCGELFSMLAQCKAPLTLGYDQTSPDAVHNILENHPGLVIILTNLPNGCARNVYPLLKKFPELYLETIGFKPLEGVEDVCEKFGAGRLIFGSGAPLYSGGAAIGMLSYASISEEEKDMIAHKNLEQLLERVSL